jgi:uncharacterized membrane protein
MNRHELDALLAPHFVSAATTVRALALSDNLRSRVAWQRFGARAFGLAGMSTLAAALMFFIAANWQAMGVLGHFGLVQSVVLASVGVAWWKAPLREEAGAASVLFMGALIFATLASGGLLALFGQTYQTGADVYELFFAWALLTLPFALAGMSGAVWAVWICILNVALALWARPLGFGEARPTATMLGFAVNLSIAALAYAVSHTRYRRTTPAWLVRMLLTFAFAYATTACVLAEFSKTERNVTAVIFIAFLLASVLLVAVTLKQKRDVYPLALTSGAWIVVTTALLFEHASHGEFLDTALLGCGWVVLTSTAAGAVLMHCVRAWRVQPRDGGAAL